jgi:signal transduction histidine kinase
MPREISPIEDRARPLEKKQDSDRLGAELVRIWLESQTSVFISVTFSLIAIKALWNSLPHETLAVWGISMTAWSGLRYWVWRRFWSKTRSDGETVRWGHFFVSLLLVTGLLTAYIAFQVLSPAETTDRMFITIWTAGLTAGAAVTYGAYPFAVLAYAGPALIAFSAAIFRSGMPNSILVGLAVWAYLVLLLTSAQGLNRWVVNIFKLRIHNEELTSNLIAAKEAAEAANEAKSVFMANMNHELRTPLNAVIGFAEMLENEFLGPLGNPRYVDYARDVRMSGQHLLSIVNTILDLAKSGAAHLEMDCERIDICKLLRECFEVMELQATKAGVVFKIEVPDQPLFAEADETRLRQVVYNLLSNAIKFTNSGGNIALIGESVADGGVAIQVSDSGIGMDPDDIDIALRPFMQVKKADGRASPGTGLGLPFAKSIVELHGGKFTITSERGAGTTVRVTLPERSIKAAPTLLDMV